MKKTVGRGYGYHHPFHWLHLAGRGAHHGQCSRYTAMIATGNARDFNLHADLAKQAAEDLVDLTFE